MHPMSGVMAAGTSSPAYAWNPSDKDAALTLSNGNHTLTESGAAGSIKCARGTVSKASGKWYTEITPAVGGVGYNHCVGVMTATANLASFIGSDAQGWGWIGSSGDIQNGGISRGTYATWTGGDRLGIAVDLDAHKLWLAKSNVWQSGDPAAGTGGLTIASSTWFAAGGSFNAAMTIPFTLFYAPPSGFLIL